MVRAKWLPILPQIVSVGFNWSNCSHKAKHSFLSFTGNFSHQQGDGTSFSLGAIGRTPLKSCETNLPAAVSCSHVFVNWAISVNFWNWVDRLGTGASFQLHRIAPFVHFRVTRLSHGLMSHGCSFKDWYWTTVTQIMSHKRCHVTFPWNQI